MASSTSDDTGAGQSRSFAWWPRVAAAFTLTPLLLLLVPRLWDQTQLVTVLDHTDFWRPFFYMSRPVGPIFPFLLAGFLVLGMPLHLYLVRNSWHSWKHYLLVWPAVTLTLSVGLVSAVDVHYPFAVVLISTIYGAVLGLLVWAVLVSPWRLLLVIGGGIVLWPVALGMLQGRFGAIPGDRFADTLVAMNFAGEHLNVPRNFIQSTGHNDQLGFYSVTLGFILPDLAPMTRQIAARIIPPRSFKARTQRPDPQHYLKVRLEDANNSNFIRLLARRPNLKTALPDIECVERPDRAGLSCSRYLEIRGNLWAVYTLEQGQPPHSDELDRRIRSIITSFMAENQ